MPPMILSIAANGREDATGNHEDEHVADAVHQVLVDDVAHGLLLGSGVVRRGVGNLFRKLALCLCGKSLVDEPLGILDGGGHADADHGLARKALGLDVLVGSDNDGLRSLDLRGGHLVLDAHLPVGLHLNGEALGRGGFLKRLLGHVGVGNARRTTGSGNEVVRRVFGHTFTPLSCGAHSANQTVPWGRVLRWRCCFFTSPPKTGHNFIT